MTIPRTTGGFRPRLRTRLIAALILIGAGLAAGCSSTSKSEGDDSEAESSVESDNAVASEAKGRTEDLAAEELGGGSNNTPAPDFAISQPTMESTPPEPLEQPASGGENFSGNFSEVSVSDIRYLAKKGGGTVVVETSAPATYQVREVPTQSQVVIELANAQLPDRLKRPYITKDFGQSITSINAYQDKGSSTVRVVVQFRSPMHAEVEQIGRELSMRAADSLGDVENAPTLGASANHSYIEQDADSNDDDSASSFAGTDRDPRILPPLPAERMAGEDIKFYGKPISIEVRDTPVRDVISLIAEQSGTNIVLATEGEGSAGNITMKLRQVPWDQALMIVLRSRNLGYVRQGTVLRVAPFDSLHKEAESARRVAEAQKLAEPLRVKVVPVGYAKVDEMVKQVSNFVSKDRGKVVADPRTNSLVITDTPDVLERIGNLVKALDLPPLQVLIEGKVIEAREIFTRSLGVNWTSAWDFGPSRNLSLGYSPSYDIPRTGGLFNFGVTGFDALGDLSAYIGLAESQDQVKVVSSPRVVALNNEPASILQGTQIGVQSLTTTGTSVTRTTTFKDIEMKLEVTPQVTSESDVIMQISIKREFASEVKQGTSSDIPPNINRREAKTKVLVRNGQTAVIGGVYQSDSDELDEGVPWLKNLPVLGWLFKSKHTNQNKTELLVFLTPRILNAETSLPKEGNL